jgi:hypothetical protein
LSHEAIDRRRSSTQSNLYLPGFAFLALVSGLAYVGMVRVDVLQGTLRDQWVPQTIGWYGLAFVAYLATLLWAERQRSMPHALVWGAAILFRLFLLLTTPTLSDDVYRYLWDGHLVSNGVSPYLHAIEASQLDGLAVPVRDLANHTWMASPYLPAAQGVFAVLAWLFPLQPLVMQAAMVGFDLLTALLIARLLPIAGLPGRYSLIYLWNPLIVVEAAHGAHVDALMVALTMLALWLTLGAGKRTGDAPEAGRSGPTPGEGEIGKGRPSSHTWWDSLGAVVLALATLTKPLPALLLPVLLPRWRWRPLILYGLILAVLIVPAGLIAGWGLGGPLDGRGLFGPLRVYIEQWNFNSGLFHGLERGLIGLGMDPGAAGRIAKRMMGLAMLAVLLAVTWLAHRRRSTRGFLRLATVPFLAYILLTTTVHPWYLWPVLALLPFQAPADEEPSGRWLLLLPWLYLSGALVLSYLTYIDPLNLREYPWVRWVEWLPTYILLLMGGVWLIWRQRRTGASRASDLESESSSREGAIS